MTQQEFETEWNDSSDSVVCRTSGSTGMPKEIRLSKDFMIESARRTNTFFDIKSSSRLHTCLDFQYIASKMMTVRANIAKCTLTSEVPSNRPLNDVAADEVITLLSIVPSQMHSILDSKKKYCNIRNILIGGAPLPPMLRARISLSTYNVWESYGMTETASHIALRKVTMDASAPFVALPGITVGSDAEGCLVVHMPGIDPIVTTDFAEVLSDTEFRILGRADHCVISGGIKIIPEQLEASLGHFIAFDYCISSVPDHKWGERLVLVVEANGSSFAPDIIAKAVSVRLNQFKKLLNLGAKTPKDVIVIEKIPRTSNGKLDRTALKTILSSAV